MDLADRIWSGFPYLYFIAPPVFSLACSNPKGKKLKKRHGHPVDFCISKNQNQSYIESVPHSLIYHNLDETRMCWACFPCPMIRSSFHNWYWLCCARSVAVCLVLKELIFFSTETEIRTSFKMKFPPHM